MVSNSFAMLLIIFFILLGVEGMPSDAAVPFATAILLVIAVCEVMIYYFWKRTTFTFLDSEIYVLRDTVSRNEKHIQYAKLASVNVRRGWVNLLFGTATLTFNVNSSINSGVPEASLCLKLDEANRLREELSAMIFNKEMVIDEDNLVETLAHVSNRDIILHGILGQPTSQFIFGGLMLLYAIAMALVGSGSGVITALIFLMFSEVVPRVSTIMRYYNYRIYRVDDTITVESGMFTKYRSSFNINKINSVRIREPLFARILGKATLEAEVVGMANDNNIPILCPLKARDEVFVVMRNICPELHFESEVRKQPRGAMVPMLVSGIVTTIMVEVFLMAISLIIYPEVPGPSLIFFQSCILAAIIVIPAVVFIRVVLAQKNRDFDIGTDSFRFTYGAYDLVTEYVNYDKVQVVRVSAGPLQRRFGVSRCQVSLMSSAGATTITSGLFAPDDLEDVFKIVMGRISDGRYDYRKYY